MAKFDAHLKCSFCGKSQDQVRKLIAGPGVYICDECIDLCNEILDEELVDGQGNPRHSHEPSRKATPAARKNSKPAPTLASIPRPQGHQKLPGSTGGRPGRRQEGDVGGGLQPLQTSGLAREMATARPRKRQPGCTRATSC